MLDKTLPLEHLAIIPQEMLPLIPALTAALDIPKGSTMLALTNGFTILVDTFLSMVLGSVFSCPVAMLLIVLKVADFIAAIPTLEATPKEAEIPGATQLATIPAAA